MKGLLVCTALLLVTEVGWGQVPPKTSQPGETDAEEGTLEEILSAEMSEEIGRTFASFEVRKKGSEYIILIDVIGIDEDALASYWAGAYGYGLAYWTRPNQWSGAERLWRKCGSGNPCDSPLQYKGLSAGQIRRVVVYDGEAQFRKEKVDEYGNLLRPRARRTRLKRECVLSRGSADKFNWDEFRFYVPGIEKLEVPPVVKREAAKATRCRSVVREWKDWQKY